MACSWSLSSTLLLWESEIERAIAALVRLNRNRRHIRINKPPSSLRREFVSDNFAGSKSSVAVVKGFVQPFFGLS
jgi:hypothetical protein